MNIIKRLFTALSVVVISVAGNFPASAEEESFSSGIFSFRITSGQENWNSAVSAEAMLEQGASYWNALLAETAKNSSPAPIWVTIGL